MSSMTKEDALSIGEARWGAPATAEPCARHGAWSIEGSAGAGIVVDAATVSAGERLQMAPYVQEESGAFTFDLERQWSIAGFVLGAFAPDDADRTAIRDMAEVGFKRDFVAPRIASGVAEDHVASNPGLTRHLELGFEAWRRRHDISEFEGNHRSDYWPNAAMIFDAAVRARLSIEVGAEAPAEPVGKTPAPAPEPEF
ncbi:hypothetical protein GE300_14615 [Rhodobacteraceae bacterium 2CG4]|uniref:Uncharacterized protein n=1 Tax=Halovulum marinum TaxID=2662447 RepID=A0A6L5Z4A0_9RHOB|nr:hypothetical protein [Halovulum marinum]MSU90834.1 hypothetical protein [Halovulum marinum]